MLFSSILPANLSNHHIHFNYFKGISELFCSKYSKNDLMEIILLFSYILIFFQLHHQWDFEYQFSFILKSIIMVNYHL